MEAHSVFNDLDYAIIGIVLLSGILALMRGFMRELFSLIAWVGAYFVADKFYEPVVPWVHHYVKNEKYIAWAAMGVVFVIALIILSIVGMFICSFIKGRALTVIDRSLGFAYGLARGALVVCLVYLCVQTVLWPNMDAPPVASDEAKEKDHNNAPELLVHAKTRPLMANGADLLTGLLPKEMMDKMLQGVEKEKEDAEKNARQKQLDEMSTPTPQNQQGTTP